MARERISRSRTANKAIQFIQVSCGTGFYKRQEKKLQREKKDDPSLAICENYIKKIFLFFDILFMDVFTYRLTVKNPKILATEKGDKKFPQLFTSFTFYLVFTGIGLTHRSLATAHSISE